MEVRLIHLETASHFCRKAAAGPKYFSEPLGNKRLTCRAVTPGRFGACVLHTRAFPCVTAMPPSSREVSAAASLPCSHRLPPVP